MSAPAVMLFVMTEAGGVAHLITEDAMAAGRPTGRYATVCGGQILAASLTAPKRSNCRSCRRKRASR